ncbi:MAG: insulinase family protein [Candidatus Sericytochromatia bacterium]|nr:insulinase family protein [Candidatus Sericytochromatia bacterium]
MPIFHPFRTSAWLVATCCLLGLSIMPAAAKPPAKLSARPAMAKPAVLPNRLVTEGHLSRGRLPNGLRVVIREDPGSGVVAVNAWVHAGGKDETDALCGYSHYLEHLTFRGTKRRAPLQSRLEIFNVGGENSANTYYDRTTYYNVVATPHFRLALDSLADLLFNATLTPQAVEQERQVVSEELRQGLDRPDTKAIHALMAAIFQGHPYERPVIGNFDTLNGLKQDDFHQYYRRMYVPNNMVLSINGDVRAADAWAAVQETFGKVPASPKLAEKPAFLQGFSGYSRQVLHLDQQRHTALMGFRAPGYRHPDRPACDLLVGLLGGDAASRLYQRLVFKQPLATYASASYTPFEQHGMVTLSAAPLEGGTVGPLAVAILEEIHKLQTMPVDPADLMRLQRQMDRQEVFGLGDTLSPAYALGEAELYGDLRYAADYKQWRKAVTPADIQRVAKLYFRPDNLSLLYSLPKEGGEPTPEADLAVEAARQRLTGHAIASVDWQRTWLGNKPSPLPVLERATDGNRQIAQRWVLPNGLTVILEPRHRLPIIVAELVLPAGSRHDPPGLYGLANVAGETLTSGTQTFDQETIARKISEWGGYLWQTVGRETTRVRLQVTREDALAALTLVGSLVREPLLADEEVVKERDKAFAALKRQADEVTSLVDDAYRTAMYAGSGLAHRALGTPESLGKLDGLAVRAFARSHYVPRGAVLAIVGDTNRAEVDRWLLSAQWHSWQGGPAAPKPGGRPTPQSGQVHVTKTSQQVQLYVGFPGVGALDPDVPAMRVLTGMVGFQAFVDLIYGKALAYSVGASTDRYTDSGSDYLYMGTAGRNRDEALRELTERWRLLGSTPLDPGQVAQSRDRILGGQILADQHWMGRATGLATYEWNGMGFAAYDAQLKAVEQLTFAQLQEVATRRVRLDQLLTVTAGGD